jgi:hypothetical protein
MLDSYLFCNGSYIEVIVEIPCPSMLVNHDMRGCG